MKFYQIHYNMKKEKRYELSFSFFIFVNCDNKKTNKNKTWHSSIDIAKKQIYNAFKKNVPKRPGQNGTKQDKKERK